jgi:pSer/pThr/pTyr-binding forkhead associated (FHA) protein
MGAIFNASGRTYYILEHKMSSKYHQAGESQKIIVDQIELGRDSSCQVRFDESFETVSRRHAAIVRDGENWKLIPLSTTNATLVNGQVVSGEWHLKSGDEIRLSSRGPVLGFILPQGERSLVKSIGLTERMNLFRQQALRPYKTALWILAVVLVLAVAGLVTWNILQGQKFEQELQYKQEQIIELDGAITESNEVIDALNTELEQTKEESAVEAAKVQRELYKAKAQRDALIKQAESLKTETEAAIDAAVKAGRDASSAQRQLRQLEQQMEQDKAEVVRQKEEENRKLEEQKASGAIRHYGNNPRSTSSTRQPENQRSQQSQRPRQITHY